MKGLKDCVWLYNQTVLCNKTPWYIWSPSIKLTVQLDAVQCSKTMLSLQQGDEVFLSCAIQVNFKMQ